MSLERALGLLPDGMYLLFERYGWSFVVESDALVHCLTPLGFWVHLVGGSRACRVPIRLSFMLVHSPMVWVFPSTAHPRCFELLGLSSRPSAPQCYADANILLCSMVHGPRVYQGGIPRFDSPWVLVHSICHKSWRECLHFQFSLKILDFSLESCHFKTKKW